MVVNFLLQLLLLEQLAPFAKIIKLRILAYLLFLLLSLLFELLLLHALFLLELGDEILIVADPHVVPDALSL